MYLKAALRNVTTWFEIKSIQVSNQQVPVFARQQSVHFVSFRFDSFRTLDRFQAKQ